MFDSGCLSFRILRHKTIIYVLISSKRSYLTSVVRGGGREELPNALGWGRWRTGAPHIQGAVAVWAQQGREELLHIQGQEGWK